MAIRTAHVWMSLRVRSLRSSYFFFSSRRRHTRWTGDWSSDVCSSDLLVARSEDLALLITREMGKPLVEARAEVAYGTDFVRWYAEEAVRPRGDARELPRSEERRVGKECRSRWRADEAMRKSHNVDRDD